MDVRRWMRRLDPVVLGLIVPPALPIVWAVARAIADGWIPIGDQALLQIRAYDVLTAHHPLLGTASSAALNRGGAIPLNHPGPLLFDALALPVRLFGAAGVALGVGALNLAAAALGCVFAARRAGRAGAALAALTFACLGWAAGSTALYDPFNPTAAMMPCLACVFLAWSAADLDPTALPWLLGVATFCVQLNNSYLLFLAPLCVLAGGVHVVRARRVGTMRWRRTGLWCGGVLAVLWSQPLVEQLWHGRNGNLALMWKASGVLGDNVGPRMGTQVAARTLSLPPFWSRSRFDGVRLLTPVPGLAVATVSLVVLSALLGAACARAWRRGFRTAAAALLTAVGSVAIAWVATTRTPESSFFGINPEYSRWLWPVSVFLWFAVALAAWTVAAPKIRARFGSRALLAVAAGAVLAVSVANVPQHTVLQSERSLDDQRALAIRLVDQAAGHIDAARVLYVRPPGYDTFGPPLLARLQRDGVAFFVDDEVLVRQFGEGRRYSGQPIPSLRVFTGMDAIDVATDPTLVAYVSGIDTPERGELLALITSIEGWLRDGRITLSDAGRATVDIGLAPPWFTELPSTLADAAEISRSFALADAIIRGQFAAAPDVMVALARYAVLRSNVEASTAAVALTQP